VLEVVDPGLGLALQDRGRPAAARLGVPPSGALDSWGHRAACILAGAGPDGVTAEALLGGAELLAVEACAVALAGADLGAERDDGRSLPAGRVHLLPKGARLRFSGSPSRLPAPTWRGVRAYLGLAGGIEARRVLGAAATLASAGLGGIDGRAALAGDRLVPVRRGDLSAAGHAWPDELAPHPAASSGPVLIVPGPDLASLPAGVEAAFLGTPWTVATDSDRMGLRLEGPALASGDEILSHPLVPGAVQIPPGGQPLVLLADGPTLGGYPVVGVVARAELPRLGQLRPGDRLRFAAVSTEAAREAWSRQQSVLERVAAALAVDAVWHRLAADARG
jgi:biotin-dependent carboxylase-like uncharacterized protein